MHLKEAYQRRIKQQVINLQQPQKMSNNKHNKKIDHQNVIGSVHTGSINYDKSQPFFIDYKVKDQIKQAKKYIQTLKDPDILELKNKSWNISVASPRKFSDFQKEESHKSNWGYSDFVGISDKTNKIYQGTQTRDSFHGWNVSTYIDKSEKTKGILNTNLNAFDNTIKYNTSNLPNYKSLSNRYNETVNLNKSQLINNSQIIQDFKQSFVFYHPGTSPERANANALKMYDQIKRQKLKLSLKLENQTQDTFNTSFKANLSPTQKMKIKYKYFHTGKWQKNNTNSPNINIKETNKKSEVDDSDQQSNQEYAWSCCMNSSKDSRGCSYRVEDGNKMNLSSFNNQ